MNILVYGLNFTPELTGIGKYTSEMAAWLADRGHNVRVITTPPYSSAGKIGKGYSSWIFTKAIVKGVQSFVDHSGFLHS